MSKKENNPNLEDSPDDSYNMRIKKRLARWLEQFQNNGFEINFSKLCSNMYQLYNLETSEQKLRKMFDTMTPDREIKLAELVALSHMLDIPLPSLCEFPNTPSVLLDRPWIYEKRKSNKVTGISKLINHWYQGEYFAYYFKPKHYDRLSLGGNTPISGSNIEQARIEICIENGEPYVILEQKTTNRDFYNQKDLDKFILKGKLYLLESSKIAYCFMMDPAAKRAIALMFEFKDFSKDILFFCTAAMLTISLNEIHSPLFQKIAMFRIKQDLDNPRDCEIIRGILALNTGPIMIDATDFDFVKEHSEDTFLREKLTDLYSKREEKMYYVFSEPGIRDSVQNWTSEESVEILLKLREMSTFQAHEIVTETEYFRTFIKSYQQKHKNFPNN